MSTSFVDALPQWLLFLLDMVVVLLSIEAGWRLGDHQRRRHESEQKAPISAMVGATMGLLAFLLAFTFGMAANRFDNRKQTVLQEANAIGTTHLRTSFLPEADRAEARQILRDYTALRAGGVATILSEQGIAQASALQARLWAIVSEAMRQNDNESMSLLTESVNNLIDLDTVRLTVNRNRIPESIWVMLATVGVFSMASMGFEFGLSGRRSRTLTILMAITFTAVITLIADLDQAQSGMLQVSQQPLTDLLKWMGTLGH